MAGRSARRDDRRAAARAARRPACPPYDARRPRPPRGARPPRGRAAEVRTPSRLQGEGADGQGVARAEVRDPATLLERECPGGDELHQLRGLVLAEGPQVEHREPAPHVAHAGADRGEHEDRVDQQPPGHEGQRLGGRGVQQVSVVDHQSQGARLRLPGEQGERRRRHREPVHGPAARAGPGPRPGRAPAAPGGPRRGPGTAAAPAPARRRAGRARPRSRVPPASRKPWAVRRAWSSRALLPRPASPLSTSTPLRPTRAPDSSASRVRCSSRRPMSMVDPRGPRLGGAPDARPPRTQRASRTTPRQPAAAVPEETRMTTARHRTETTEPT